MSSSVVPALLCALVAFPAIASGQPETAFEAKATYRVPLGEAPVRGPASAPITIVEFSAFNCRYCYRAQSTLLKLLRLYPGQIRVAYRYFPLDLEEATLAAEAAVAAGLQGLFWPMHDRIFAANGVVSRARLEVFALEIGLDLARFRRDLDSGAMRRQIHADVALASELGVYSTPTFFVNGRPISGARPLAVFVAIVTEELARARALIAGGVAPDRVYSTIVASGITAKSGERSGEKPGEQRGESQGKAEPETEPQDTGRRSHGLDETKIYRLRSGLPGHSVGPDDALVTVVVFSDFECPYCARFAPALAAMLAEYKDDLRIVIRHLPLRFHRKAELAAEAVAAAAAQGKMWLMHEQLSAHPDALTRPDLERYARAISLDMKRFRSDLNDRRYLNAIAGDAATAEALGITATPTVIVNGSPVHDAKSYDDVKYLFIEPKLEQARELVRRGIARRDIYANVTASADYTELGFRDLYTGVIEACKVRDYSRAKDNYRKLSTLTYPGTRNDWGASSPVTVDQIRIECRTYGIDFPVTDRATEWE